jgi:hypothetical protein
MKKITLITALYLLGPLWCVNKKSSFTLIRVMQTGMIAAVIPLVISTFTNDGGGGTTLGFLNSGRFVVNT